jgi:hypothetical protein
MDQREALWANSVNRVTRLLTFKTYVYANEAAFSIEKELRIYTGSYINHNISSDELIPSA